MKSRGELLEQIAVALDGSSMLITGATGFVGRSTLGLIRKIAQNYEISLTCTLVARKIEKLNETQEMGLKTACFEADLGVPQTNLPVADVVIHAAMPQPARSNISAPSEMLLATIETSRILLQNFKSWGTEPKVLFTSSGAVYGESPDPTTCWTENSRYAPPTNRLGSAYAEGKRVAETLFCIGNQDSICDARIARMFAFSGAFLPLQKHFAVGNFVHNALQGRDIIIQGDGKAIRSYLDSEDMAIWLLGSLLWGESSAIYHVGSESEISISDLANTVADRANILLGKRLIVKTLEHPNQNAQLNRYVPSTAQTRSSLGVEEWTPLIESIDKMIYHAQPN